MRLSSKPSYQYDRLSKQLTVTMNGRKHKLGKYGDPESARRAATAFIQNQEQQLGGRQVMKRTKKLLPKLAARDRQVISPLILPVLLLLVALLVH